MQVSLQKKLKKDKYMKKIITSFLILFSTTLLIKILNFIREIEVAYFYGTSNITNQFVLISVFPNLILNSLAPAVGILYLSKIVKNDNKFLSIDYKKNIYLSLFIILILLLNIFYLNDIYLIIPSTLMIILYFVQVNLVYYHQAFDNFRTGSLSSSLQAFIIIIIIALAYYLRVDNLVYYSISIALFVQIIILLISIYKKNYFIEINNTIEKDYFKSIISVFLGIGLIEILMFICKFFIDLENIKGNLSEFNYAFKLANLPNSILVFSLISVLFPKLSRVKENNMLLDMNRNVINLLLNFQMLFSILVTMFSYNIVSLIYERGNFKSDDVQIVSNLFTILIFALIFVSIITIQYRTLFLINKFNGLIINSVFQIILLSALLSAILLFKLSISEVCLSILFVSFIGSMINAYLINKKIDVSFIISLIWISLILLLGSKIVIISGSIYYCIIIYIQIIKIKNESW